MFKVCVYFGAVTGGENDISGSPGLAAPYVFRTHSITFTRNDVSADPARRAQPRSVARAKRERPPLGPGPPGDTKILQHREIPYVVRFWPPLTRENTHPPRQLPK